MNRKTITIIVILAIFVFSYTSYIIGKEAKQREIEARVWPHQKDCYNEQDLEIIIFGEIQE